MPILLAEVWDLSVDPWNVMCRLGLAVLFGGLVGFERQTRHKHADPRTLILVALGAAMFVVAAQEVIASSKGLDHLGMLGTIMGGVVGGVGFLGAGAIIHQENRVEGVTTAAAIWITAGIGLTCGLGEFMLSIMVGTTVLVTLLAARLFDRLGTEWSSSRKNVPQDNEVTDGTDTSQNHASRGFQKKD